MTHLETQHTAVKLLGRACLNGFITTEAFPENRETTVNAIYHNHFKKLSFFKERLKQIHNLIVRQVDC